MKTDRKVLLLMLTGPLLLYAVPYAYAAQISSSYVLTTSQDVSTQAEAIVSVHCNPGDYATGGGVFNRNLILIGSYPYPSSSSPTPTTWIADVINPSTTHTNTVQVYVVCQTPITVAGIGVPEFGSLYSAIALAAVVYFGLTILRQRRTPTIPAPK